MDALAHWDGIYRTKVPSELSWQQDEPRLSLELIGQVALARDAAILDVGGGASRLVDALVARGYTNLTVLDLAPSALQLTRTRLGAAGEAVHWLAADVCTVPLAPNAFDVWHDRAVFHFLTTAPARAAYLAQVRHALRPGGHVVVATFAEDGPTRFPWIWSGRCPSDPGEGLCGSRRCGVDFVAGGVDPGVG